MTGVISHAERMRESYARMSGQIAQAFTHLPEPEAAAAVARHINLFWSRSMRRDLALSFTKDSLQLHVIVRLGWGDIRFPD
jgi:hypothetical protein